MAGIGVDGCKGGWFYFQLDGNKTSYGFEEQISDLALRAPELSTLLIDIPIGLKCSGHTERLCDIEARRVLSNRRSSVFPAPCRQTLDTNSYEAACEINRKVTGKGLSKQSWAITDKISEVDQALQNSSKARTIIREAHPEVCFWGLAGRSMHSNKKTRDGFRERLEVLEQYHNRAKELIASAFLEFGGFEAARDDIVDAFALALVASKIDQCLTLPSQPEKDATGLSMEMVYFPTTTLR